MVPTFIAFATLLATSVPESDRPVQELIARVLPGRGGEFVCQTIPSANGKDVFEIASTRDKIILRGNTGVSIASGFNWYLKHVANAQVSRRGDQLALPTPLPRPTGTIRKVSPYASINFMNYCTYCYTAPFWNWQQWEREIDLMAMSGVKLTIMPLGNEIVWQNVLTKVGCSKADIAAYIPTCAFTTWWLMGNLEGEGGPVPQRLIDDESTMAKRVIARMRALGIEPILEGFCGTVPTTLPKVLPNAHIVDQGQWAGGYHRPSVLSPLDPEFTRIATLWYAEQTRLYGKAKYYGGDLFHEGGHSAGLDLAGCATSVQREMRRDNPDAVWVLQGWSGNPPRKLLEATDPDHLLVESFLSYPQDVPISEYAGRPWTFTMINTFGGHETLGGSLKMLASIPSHLLNRPTNHNVGFGIGDEGLDTNSAVYDLASDMVWEDHDVDLDEWARQYAIRRYGVEDPRAVAFWKTMAFDLLGHQAENLLCAWPRFGVQSTSSWGDTTLTHDLGKMLDATKLLLACNAKLGHLPTYRADCEDAMRQVLNDHGVELYEQLSSAYANHDAKRFDALSHDYLEVLTDCDRLFSAGEFTLLGKWIAEARAKGHTPEEKALLERSARQLVTLWTPQRTDLTDYAYRNWGGLMRDYYLPRWRSFLTMASNHLHGTGPEPDYADADTWKQWVSADTPRYPARPVGDAATVAKQLLAKYESRCAETVAYWKAVQDEIKRWQWSLSNSTDPAQVLVWDVTDKLKALGGGKFTVTVEYQSGGNAIVVSKVELLEKTTMAVNDTQLSVDEHPGRSGLVTKDNVYHLDAGPLAPGAQYLLRVVSSGDGGNDSQGRIVVEKAASPARTR